MAKTSNQTLKSGIYFGGTNLMMCHVVVFGKKRNDVGVVYWYKSKERLGLISLQALKKQFAKYNINYLGPV